MSQTSKRSVKPNRQQLVVVIGDNSGSMRGLKAEAATEGIRQMIIECMSRSGGEESLYRVLFISFGDRAKIDKHGQGLYSPANSESCDDLKLSRSNHPSSEQHIEKLRDDSETAGDHGSAAKHHESDCSSIVSQSG